MLEIKHLCKKYRTKNGVVTNALDDVSLTFPETGMVFILGKSGSGKSTLLNVCGGLDKPDSGEIVIKGKSSRDFTTQDFDSYRNTYVGFVFQEYNVLNEFSVEENIALALELQGKKRDKAAIDNILGEVDMRELALRKPNTLSGGQKQRVAIARALVKSPEIIMADEPTGALDSATGRQVFDTLKSLSKNKLVLVVSHDRDFAEQYGDRIIELKDGKVISDQVRVSDVETVTDADGNVTEIKRQKKNVRFFGTDTVCIENGADITDDDLTDIKNFLRKSGGAAVISTSRDTITGMKKDAPELDVGGFEELPAQPESKTYEPQTLIRSKLPMRHAIRVGASGLKTKPVRLVFTILLSVAAFVMFGLASTLMLFNEKRTTVSTLMNSDYDYIALHKTYYETIKTYYGDRLLGSNDYENYTSYTPDEYAALKEKYDGAIAAFDSRLDINNVSMNDIAGQFYTSYIDGFILANESLELCDGGGRLPQAADEIAISDYMFDGLRSPNTYISCSMPNDRDEYVPVKIKPDVYADVLYTDKNPVLLDISGQKFKIVGIYKGTAIPDEYKKLKSAADEGLPYNDRTGNAYNWLYSVRGSGMYARLAVTEELLRAAVEMNKSDYVDSSDYFDYNAATLRAYTNEEYYCAAFYMAARYADGTGHRLLKLYAPDGSEVTDLGAGQIAVHAVSAACVYYDWLNEYCERESVTDAEVLKVLAVLADISGNDKDTEYADYIDWYASENREKLSQTLKAADEYIDGFGIARTLELMSEYDSTTKNAELVAVFYEYCRGCCYLSDELYEALFVQYMSDYYSVTETKYVVSDDAFISTVFVPYSGGRGLTTELVDMMFSRADDDSSVTIVNPVMSQLEIVTMLIKLLGKVFMAMGIVLALFAFLLMFNFISASIAAKKKEIGILRAIGARSWDVFKIFLSEAMIISLICFVVAVVMSLCTCAVLNLAISLNTFIKVSVFVFGPLSVLCVLGIAIVTGVLATVIPVAVYSKKPPVDSIRAL